MKKLVQYISLYTKLYSQEFSVERLMEDLPLKKDNQDLNINSEEDFISIVSKVSQTAGYNANIKSMQSSDINLLDLPAIAKLNNNDFCIIENINDNLVSIIQIENNEALKKIFLFKILNSCFLIKYYF